MNLLDELKQKYEASKAKKTHEQDFAGYLTHAVQTGKLTPVDMAALDKQKQDFGLTDNDLKNIKVEGYLAAFNAAKASTEGLTEDESKELDKIQTYLGIPDQEIASTKRELAHLRLLSEISHGNLPTTQVANVFLTGGEKVYWAEPASLLEQKVSHQWQGGNQGFSLRVTKRVTYRVGQTRGHVIANAQSVSVSQGQFIITSKRVIFSGNAESFAIPLNKLINVQCQPLTFCNTLSETLSPTVGSFLCWAA